MVRPRQGLGGLRRQFGPFEACTVVFLCVAALSSYSGPTAPGVADPAVHVSIWSIEPFPPLDLAVLGLVALTALWLVSALTSTTRVSTLDACVGAVVALIGILHALALARSEPGLLFQALDLGNVLLFAGGYFVVTRVRLSHKLLGGVMCVIAALVLLHTLWLVVRYGLPGKTEFFTSSGREALLTTEDSLLVALPLLIAWGFVVDRVGGRWLVPATALLAACVGLVELLSLRRGALIFIVLLIALRALYLPRRRLLMVVGVTAATLTAALAIGSAGSLASDVSYSVRSALLMTEDESSQLRRAELRDFTANLRDFDDVALGRGLGAVWSSSADSRIDPVAFGSEETSAVRVGWHVYGLDWLYKLGILGGLVTLGVATYAGALMRSRLAGIADKRLRSLGRSLALVSPVLLLFLFTNPRVALFAGIVTGGLSALTTYRPASSRAAG